MLEMIRYQPVRLTADSISNIRLIGLCEIEMDNYLVPGIYHGKQGSLHFCEIKRNIPVRHFMPVEVQLPRTMDAKVGHEQDPIRITKARKSKTRIKNDPLDD